MKANNFLQVFLLIVSLGFISYANAQQPKLCGSYKIDRVALNEALKFEKKNPVSKTLAANMSIRVYFHIFTYDDGSNAAATLTQINEEFSTLAAAYAADNICFLNAGVNYIYSSFLDTGFNANTDPSTDISIYQVSNCINVFYSKQIKGSNSACSSNCGIGGTSFTIPSTFCLIAQGNINKGQTVAHEVGHCFGLLHTFETGNGFEDIDGSNSGSAADLITDTPADPYAYNNQSCYSVLGCSYNGSCKDPKNQSNFSAPYTNMMAYWWAYGCYPSLIFSSNQFVRINSFLNTNTGLLNCESPSNYFINGPFSLSSGYYFPSAINTLSTSGSVTLSASINATLGGQTVLAEPGFRATPSGSGLVLLRASACSGSSLRFVNSTKQDAIAENDVQDKNKLIAYPNPTSSLVKLTFNLGHSEKSAIIQVYDMNMIKVKEMRLDNLISGKQTVQLNLENLSSDIYLVVLKLSSSQLTAKVVLAK